MAIATEDGIAILPGIVLDAIKYGGIIVGDQIRHDHTNIAWRLLAKTLSKGIGTVIQLFRQFLDFCPHLLTHFVAPTQRP